MKKLILLLALACLAGCGASSNPTSPGGIDKPAADSLSASPR